MADKKVEVTQKELDEAVEKKSAEKAQKLFNDEKENIIKDIQAKIDKQPSGVIYHNSLEVKHENVYPVGRAIRTICAAAYQSRSWQDINKEWAVTDSSPVSSYIEKVLGGVNTKGMTVGTPADGGVFVPEFFENEIIPLLYANTVFRKAGTRVLPLPRGNSTIRAGASGSTGVWIDEAVIIPESIPHTKEIKLVAKKAGVFVNISNDLIRYNDILADRWVEFDVSQRLALLEDAAYINGTGNLFTPKGFENWMNASQVFARTQIGGVVTPISIANDLVKAISLVAIQNIQLVNCGYIVHPSVYYSLANQYNAQGFLMWYSQTLQQSNKINGYDVYMTTQCPTDKCYFVVFNEAVIGQGLNFEVKFIPDATYIDATGAVVSGIQNDTSVIRGLFEVDFAMRYDVAGSVITTLTGTGPTHDWF